MTFLEIGLDKGCLSQFGASEYCNIRIPCSTNAYAVDESVCSFDQIAHATLRTSTRAMKGTKNTIAAICTAFRLNEDVLSVNAKVLILSEMTMCSAI